MTRPCLVYLQGPRGPEPQIWHDPMVTEAGKLAIAAPAEVVRGPYQLPDKPYPWSIGLAEAFCNTGAA